MARLYRSPWRIDVDVRPGVPLVVSMSDLARAIAAALDAAGAPAPASIGLILSDDAELTELDEAYMGEAGPTDVLSFPLLPPDSFPPHERAGQGRRAPGRGMKGSRGPAGLAAEGQEIAAATASVAAPEGFVLPPGRRPHLGDIVVSVERAIAQADAGRGGQTGDAAWSAAQELRLLVTHGALHICGWDHAEPLEETAMRALERRLLAVGP